MRAGTAAAIVRRYNAEIVRALRLPDVKASLEGLGYDLPSGTPEEFARYIAAEKSRWGAIIRAANVRLD